MALCTGLDGVGLTAYADRITSKITSGVSHVCFNERSIQRRNKERDLRRLAGDLPALSVAVRGGQSYIQPET